MRSSKTWALAEGCGATRTPCCCGLPSRLAEAEPCYTTSASLCASTAPGLLPSPETIASPGDPTRRSPTLSKPETARNRRMQEIQQQIQINRELRTTVRIAEITATPANGGGRSTSPAYGLRRDRIEPVTIVGSPMV